MPGELTLGFAMHPLTCVLIMSSLDAKAEPNLANLFIYLKRSVYDSTQYFINLFLFTESNENHTS